TRSSRDWPRAPCGPGHGRCQPAAKRGRSPHAGVSARTPLTGRSCQCTIRSLTDEGFGSGDASPGDREPDESILPALATWCASQPRGSSVNNLEERHEPVRDAWAESLREVFIDVIKQLPSPVTLAELVEATRS